MQMFEKWKQVLQKKKKEKREKEVKLMYEWSSYWPGTILVTANQCNLSGTQMGRGENGQPWRVTESFTSHSKCNIQHSGMKASVASRKIYSFKTSILKMLNLFTYFRISKLRGSIGGRHFFRFAYRQNDLHYYISPWKHHA